MLERRDQCLNWRGVHEIETDQVIDAHCFQQQHCVREIRSLNFWHTCRQHFLLECFFRVESEAFSWACTTSTTCTLLRRCLGDRCNDQRIHTQLRVVHFNLREAGIDDIVDTIDGQRGFRDVR